MNKIFSVYAIFDDGDSVSWIIIGRFTKKSVANKMKKKWQTFFELHSSILNQPENWTPESDEWYDNTEDFNWDDSKLFSETFEKHGYIECFKEIYIDEVIMDKDIFIESSGFPHLAELAVKFDRDYKLNKITE